VSAATVLIVDDTAPNRRLLTAVFRAEGMTPVAVDGGEAALAEVEARRPSIVLLDLQMPGMDGLATLARLKQLAPDVPVILLTAHGDVPSAVEAIKLGADDFITRPVHNDKLVLTVRRALERRQLAAEVSELRRRVVEGGEGLPRLMGPSAEVARIARDVASVAATGMTVLVLGETGAGKELVARAVHAASGRPGLFVALDCGALPDTLLESELFGYEKGAFSGADRRKEGHIELAAGGTLFLDEIANLSPVTQAKLLRVLQEKRVTPLGGTRPVALDVRVIAATNEALDARIAEGRFRQDLFYRLSEFVVRLPPLRARREDIEPLARRFLEEACVELHRQVVGFSPAALAALRAHPWPGNARELRNVVRRAALQAEQAEIGIDDVTALIGPAATDGAPAPLAAAPPPEGSLREIAERAAGEAERAAIVDVLRATGGNKTQAARRLQVDVKTLSAKMKRLGIDSP
jgi:DNA-binding NtrC family response regulator